MVAHDVLDGTWPITPADIEDRTLSSTEQLKRLLLAMRCNIAGQAGKADRSRGAKWLRLGQL